MSESSVKRIFFWILVISFLATAPAIVFYTMGYRFSMERGIFVYSGSITLKPTPREVNVFIDDKQVSKGVINFLNYSYHIDGLTPGAHSLRVEAPGYYEWFKKVHIHSGLSSEFWNIFLIRKHYAEVKYSVGSLDSFFISPDNKKIALVENTQEGTMVKVLNIKKEKIEYEFPFVGYKFSQEEKENIEWSPKEGRLSVPLVKDGKKVYFIINIGNNEVFNLNEKIGKNSLRMARWSSREKNVILYIFDNNLFKINLAKDSSEKLIVKDIASYDLSGSDLFYLSKQNGIIYRKDVKNDNETEQITTESVNIETGKNLRMIAYDKKRIAIISQNGDLYLYNNSEKDESIKKIGQNVLGLHFSNDGKKIVFWNKKEIFVYFTQKWETQPIRNEGDLINIVRFYQNIKNVEWFRDYEHIIFTVGDSIKMAEIDRRSHRNIYDIINVGDNNPKVIYTTQEDNLFFTSLDKKNNKKELHSISLTNKVK